MTVHMNPITTVRRVRDMRRVQRNYRIAARIGGVRADQVDEALTLMVSVASGVTPEFKVTGDLADVLANVLKAHRAACAQTSSHPDELHGELASALLTAQWMDDDS